MAREIDIRRIEVVDPQMAEVYASMTPAQRLDVAGKMHQFAKAFVETQVRGAHPEWDDSLVQRELVWRMLGARI